MTSKRRMKYSIFRSTNKEDTAESTSASTLYCWGKFSSDALGRHAADNKIESDNALPSKVSFSGEPQVKAVISVAAGYGHMVAITDDFSTQGSGDNSSGQLFPLKSDQKSINPDALTPLPSIRKDLKVVQVSCGRDFTAYLTSIGRVYTFGGNHYGQLGHSSDRKPSFVGPRMVQGIPHEICMQVSCGEYSTYVLTKHGKVYSCGLGKNGRLGVSDINKFRTTTTVQSRNLASNPVFISQILQDPEFNLQLTNLEGNKSEMTEVKGPLQGTPVISIAAGYSHCVAVSTSGNVYGWGTNSKGELGLRNPNHLRASGKAFVYEVASDDEDDDSDLYMDGIPCPTLLNVENIVNCSAGASHTLFVDTTCRRLYSAGNNSKGQLGPNKKVKIGKNVESIIKVNLKDLELAAGTKIVKTTCGKEHSGVLLSTGEVLLFGSDDVGANEDLGTMSTLSPGVKKLSNCDCFDVQCSGTLTLALKSPDYLSLLQKAMERGTLLKKLYPIGISNQEVVGGDKKNLFLKLRKTFFDMQTLNASFLLSDEAKLKREEELSNQAGDTEPMSSSFVDVEGMIETMKLYTELAMKDPEKLKIRQLIASLVAQLDFSAQNVTDSDQLRAYFILCMSPLLQKICPAEHEIVMVSIFKLPITSRRRLFSWITADIAERNVELMLDYLVKPLVKQLDVHITRRKYTKQAVYLCKLLNCLYLICMQINEKSNLVSVGDLLANPQIPSSAFYTTALDSFPDAALESMYKSWSAVVTKGGDSLNPQPNQLNARMMLGLMGMRAFGGAAELDEGPELRRQDSAESIELDRRKAEQFIEAEGPTFGLKEYGLPLVAVVDDTIEDTLNDIAPELVIFKHPFLLSANMKRRFMHIEDKNKQMMQYLNFYSSGIDPNFALPVRRGSEMLNDTFRELRALKDKPSIYLRRPLRIKFLHEEGLDAGGVKKEFFLLLSADLFSLDFGFFRAIGNTNLLWFNNSMDPSLYPEGAASIKYEEYLKMVKNAQNFENRSDDIQIIGTIMGLAMYNDTLLDVQFPSAMYQLLLDDFNADGLNISKYRQFDPNGAKQLDYILQLQDEEELESLDLTFEITQDAFGVLKEIEICPNGANKKVSMKNKEEYVHEYIKFQMFSPHIEAQARALTKGFTRVISSQQAALKLFNPDELELLLCGTPELDFKILKQQCDYEGGYGAAHKTIVRFWDILESFTYDQRKMFLKFSTGSSRAPVGGLKNIKFKVQRAGPDSGNLPTSYTCFNTLLLPDYSSKEKMKKLLLLAIENSEGFGLQ